MPLYIIQEPGLKCLILFFSSLLLCCGEEQPAPNADGAVDVYVAGSERENNGMVAKYWKNREPKQLSIQPSAAMSIVVAGEDIYVAGWEYGTSNAFYWKNGDKVFFAEIGTTTGIAVLGDDVHVIGNRFNNDPESAPYITIPLYWKNGTMHTLPLTVPGRSGGTRGISVDGTDVYICGIEVDRTEPGLGRSYPVVWKNGEIMVLEVPESYQFGLQTSAVKVVNGHVYVSGSIGTGDNNDYEFRAVYWRDNQVTILPSGTKIAFGLSLDVIKDDVYVVGYQTNDPELGLRGKYWVNSKEFSPDEQTPVILHGIAVVGDAIYLAGDFLRSTEPSTSNYWVDGIRVPCGHQSSSAYSLFIVKK